MDDKGRFPGRMKLAGAGGGLSESLKDFNGIEKSSISLFRTIPVLGDSISAPKKAFIVLVIETQFLS